MTKKLYKSINYKGELIRIYNEMEMPSYFMLYSELELVFEILQKWGYTFFWIENQSCNKIILNKDDFYYLNNFQNEIIDQNSNYIYPENIRYIKENKLKDLIFFENMKNIEFIFFIPESKNNNFYYQIILGFKNEFNLNVLNNFNSNLIFIKNVIPFKNINVDFKWIQNVFHIENNIFHEVSWKKWEIDLINIGYKNKEEWQEYKIFKKIVDNKKLIKDKESMKSYLSSKEYVEAKKAYHKKGYQATNWVLHKKLKYQFLSINWFYIDKFWDCDKTKPIINAFDEPIYPLYNEFRTYTNFNEIAGIKTLTLEDQKTINETKPCWYPLSDLLEFNAEEFGFFYSWVDKSIKIDLN